MPRHAWWFVGCLVLAGLLSMMPLPGGAAPAAAPLLALTGTPTPPATLTPTPPPPTATATPGPSVTPTATPTSPQLTVTPTSTPPPHSTPPPESSPTPTPPPTPPPTGDPRLIKSVDPSSGLPGDRIVFSIVARNDSNLPATNVVVDDGIPGAFEITGATVSQGTIDVSGQHIHAEIGTIPEGQEVIIRITTVIRAGTPPGQVENFAVMTTDTPGDDPSNNTSSAIVTIPGPQTPSRLPRTGGAGPWPVLPVLLAIVALLGGLALRARRRSS